MFRPFKKLETAWNARTPVYLHNGTKENIIFQISLTVLMLLGFAVKEELQARKEARALKAPNTEEPLAYHN